MQFTDGFAVIPDFFFSGLFPTFFFPVIALIMYQKEVTICTSAKLVNTVLFFVRWKLMFSLFLFFPWCLTMHHLQFPPLSCSQCNESKFDNCLLHPDCTRQNHLNSPKSLNETELSHFSLFYHMALEFPINLILCFAVLETKS